MPSLFPGMNPYLEEPQLWPEVHSRLVVAIADALNPQVMPKYRVALERRILLPMPEEVRESYLEIREVATGLVVTVIELLSPKNKKAEPGREAYEVKRSRVLGSRANLLEIDLLRAGQSMSVLGNDEPSLYSVIVSQAQSRPEADLYGFGLQEEMPTVMVPLQGADEGVSLNLQQILNETYERAGWDLVMDYEQEPPAPKLSTEDRAWLRSILDASALQP